MSTATTIQDQFDAATLAESERRQRVRRLDYSRAMMANRDMYVVQRSWEFDNAAGKFVVVSVVEYHEDSPGALMCDLPDGY